MVVTGSSFEVLGTQDLQTVAYRDGREDGKAEELWRAKYDGGWDLPALTCMSRQASACLPMMGSVVVTHDIVGVAGTSYATNASHNGVWTTIGYDIDSGQQKWVRQVGNPEVPNVANAISASPDDKTIYVAGFTDNEQPWDGAGRASMVAYKTGSGDELWRSDYALDGVDDAAGYGLVVDNATAFLSGQAEGWFDDIGLRSVTLTVAFDAATGERQWAARYGRKIPVLGNGDRGHWIGLAPTGDRLFVGGGYANGVRAEDPRDTWDLGVVAYDIEPAPVPSPTVTATPTISPSPLPSPEPDKAVISFTELSRASGQYSDDTRFAARLTDSEGDGIGSQAVIFELIGDDYTRTFSATTDADGVAIATPKLRDKPGNYELRVSYQGSESYESATGSTVFVIAREATTTTTELTRKDRVLKTYLLDRDSHRGIEGRKISLYADGHHIGRARSDGQGRVRVDVPARFARATHRFKAKFAGDGYYLGSSSVTQSS